MTHWLNYSPGDTDYSESPKDVVNGLAMPRLARKALEENKQIYSFNICGPISNSGKKIFKAFEKLVEDYSLVRVVGKLDEKELTGRYSGQDTIFSFTISDYYLNVDFNTLNEQMARAFNDLKLEKQLSFDRENQQVKIVAKYAGGYTAWPLGVATKKFSRDHYNADTVKEYDYIVNELKKEDPFGRLAVFYGPPGTGKTHILRAMMDSLDMNRFQFLYVPTELLTNANMAELSTLFIQQSSGRKLVLLIEDAETILAPREGTGERTDAISNLLNMADGFIGNTLDMRIVCTTNLKGSKIDEALTRPGRLISMKGNNPSEVKALDIYEAEALYKKLTGKEVKFAGPRTIAQVYALSKGIEI